MKMVQALKQQSQWSVADVSEMDREEMLGTQLHALVEIGVAGTIAGKVTGMLLELDVCEVAMASQWDPMGPHGTSCQWDPISVGPSQWGPCVALSSAQPLCRLSQHHMRRLLRAQLHQMMLPSDVDAGADTLFEWIKVACAVLEAANWQVRMPERPIAIQPPTCFSASM